MTDFKVGDTVKYSGKYTNEGNGKIKTLFHWKSQFDDEPAAIVEWDNGYTYPIPLHSLVPVLPFKYPIGTKLKSKRTDDGVVYTIIDQQKGNDGDLYNVMKHEIIFIGIKYDYVGIYQENIIDDYFYEVKE